MIVPFFQTERLMKCFYRKGVGPESQSSYPATNTPRTTEVAHLTMEDRSCGRQRQLKGASNGGADVFRSSRAKPRSRSIDKEPLRKLRYSHIVQILHSGKQSHYCNIVRTQINESLTCATSHIKSSLLCCMRRAGMTWGISASARVGVNCTVPL